MFVQSLSETDSGPHPGTKFLGGLCSTHPNVMKPMPTRKLPREKIFSKLPKKKVTYVFFVIPARFSHYSFGQPVARGEIEVEHFEAC